MSATLTIVVPAFNEEERLELTVRTVAALAAKHLDDYEIIVVNDGSTDRTQAVGDALAAEPGLRVTCVQFPANRGVGAAYQEGLKRARFPFLTLVPGDNAFRESGIARVFSAVGRAQLIVSYRVNPEARTPLRRALSRLGTATLRLLTGRPIRDAHGLYAFPVEAARAIRVASDYTYHIQALTQLLWTTDDFLEVPVELDPKPDASSGVMRWRTFRNLLGAVTALGLQRIARKLGVSARARGARSTAEGRR